MTPATIEAAIARVSAIDDARARAAANDALSAVLALHAAGLRLPCERLCDIRVDADSLLHAIAEAEVSSSLLLLHELDPSPLEERVRRALSSVRAKSRDASTDPVSVDAGGGRVRRFRDDADVVFSDERLVRSVEARS